MGRRKGQMAVMANSQLVKDRHKKNLPRKRDTDSFLHTTELDDGVTYNRINFQSVTQQSNLEDFLTTAEMAGKDFTAERQNIQIISNPSQPTRLTKDDLKKISEAQDTHKALLQIPRRPKWDVSTTKEQLTLMERDSFTDWRRQLKQLEEKDHIQLTPYEKNLDFWRQLWRVIERSDVIVQIVDARNPLLFRCEDLETYAKEVDPRKTCMLLVNKADLLTYQQRMEWVKFFNKEGITAVFFSAKAEKEMQEGIAASSAEPVTPSRDESDDTSSDSDDDVHDEDDSEKNADGDDEIENADEEDDGDISGMDNRVDHDKADMKVMEEGGDERIVSNSGKNEGLKMDLEEDTNAGISKPVSGDAVPTSMVLGTTAVTGEDVVNQRLACDVEMLDTSPSSSSIGADPLTLGTESSRIRARNSPELVSSDELLEIFRSVTQLSCDKWTEDVKTVGMVGYPNVGKSSTINVILRQKKLGVSATPGRTKHLQTLYVDSQLMLCDCPGLVFPSFVATKAHLVINGILPVDELRDHVAPCSLVCARIPRNVLEATYSIMIPQPSLDDNPNRIPTVEEFVGAYGASRGFMTQRGMPDCPRAARYILKDYVKGRLLYCNPPPGVSASEFQDKTRHAQIVASQTNARTTPHQTKSEIDKDFFTQKESKAHTRSVARKVSEFARTDMFQHSPRASMSEAQFGSQSSLGSRTLLTDEKPWKKHNNRNKKEKLRRVHRDLDV